MSIFLSRYSNKIDKKGRVSIPAMYRAGLSKEEVGGIIVYPSFKNNSIEVCSMSRLVKLNEIISNLDPYSSERDAFETVILGESVHLQFDNDGRVTLPAHLINSVGITDQVSIIGKGDVFEIWQPDHFEEYLSKAKEIAQNNRSILKNLHSLKKGVGNE